jgi:peptidyl-dipeptidase Dcp
MNLAPIHPTWIIAGCAVLASLTQPIALAASVTDNPLLVPWTTPDGVPPYQAIQPAHYAPAFRATLAEARADLAKITAETQAPSFANTIEALERAGRPLERVGNTFATVSMADATEAIQKIEEEITPERTRYTNELLLNPALYQRIDTLWKQRTTLGLTPEQDRLLEVTRDRFLRAGAALSEPQRLRVAAINEELANLSVKFGQNLLADQKASDVILTEAEVAGLSAESQAGAAARAAGAGKKGHFAIPCTRSAVEPFLTQATHRGAREKVFRAFNQRGDNGNAQDNNALITQMVRLRAERARLMGYGTHADLVLEDAMAKKPATAMALVRQVFDPAVGRAQQEQADLLAMAKPDGLTEIAPWDWRYYAEKVRQQRFDLDEAALKEYLPLDGIVSALIETTTKLFGLTFHPRTDVPVYAPDVKVWELRDADGSKVGLFYADWFARDTKRPGAWMNSMRDQNGLLGEMPIVVNNCNYTRPAPGQRATLSFDDAETLFHEFGHALHGLLSRVQYPSLSGTNVPRDFVEFPAQVYEHWIGEPEILRRHARNAKGEAIPEALLQSLLRSGTFNQGFYTVQQLSSSILDLELHSLPEIPQNFDLRAWEKERLTALKVPPAIGMRHRIAHFAHLFDSGYSASYYAYIWSEVMDSDGFEAFKETNNIFDPTLARKLRQEVYERGNTRDPAQSYSAFRGRHPTADALLRNRGLKQPTP